MPTDLKKMVREAIVRARSAYHERASDQDKCMDHLILIYELEPVAIELMAVGDDPETLQKLMKIIGEKEYWLRRLLEDLGKKVNEFEDDGGGGGGGQKGSDWDRVLDNFLEALEHGDDRSDIAVGLEH